MKRQNGVIQIMLSKMIITGLIGFGIFWLPAVNAVTYYVATNGNDTCTGSNYWTNAVATISNGVALATVAGDVVMVSNGTYNVSAEISITRGITVTSAFGMGMATVDANYGSRCFNINHANAVVDGFNVIRGSGKADFLGGGAYLGNGTVRHCVFSNNVTTNFSPGCGGGGIAADSGTVEDCIIVSNSTIAYGGGINLQPGSTGRRCRIYNNVAANSGGGVACMGTLENSWVSNNYSAACGGGAMLYVGKIRNCLVCSNTALNGGGVFLDQAGRMESCTVVSNLATSSIGGLYVCAATDDREYVANSIVYFNTGGSESNWYADTATLSWLGFTNCCLAPTNGLEGPIHVNNIAVDPQFVDFSSRDYRLKNTSPCINRGMNRDWMTNAVDLDGRMRIRYGTVDMGAYERINNGTICTVH